MKIHSCESQQCKTKFNSGKRVMNLVRNFPISFCFFLQNENLFSWTIFCNQHAACVKFDFIWKTCTFIRIHWKLPIRNQKASEDSSMIKNMVRIWNPFVMCFCFLLWNERWGQYLSIRSRHPEVFHKKGILKYFAKFTGKQRCQSLFFNKVAGLLPATY